MIIWTLAKTTFGDAMRKKILQIFLVVGIGMIIMSLSFAQTLSFSTREGAAADLNLIKSFGQGLMAIAGALIAVIMGVTLIPQEIERRTIYTILAKPVKRYEFIIGKFLGAAITLAVNIGLMGLVFLIAITVKAASVQVPSASTTSGITDVAMSAVQIFDINMVWSIILIYLQFLMLSSIVIMFSVFLTPTVNFFMGTAAYIVGAMGSVISTLAKSEGISLPLKYLYMVVMKVIPNFDKFNVVNSLLHPESVSIPMHVYVASLTGYSIVYALVMMLIAVVIFEKKEV